MADLERISRDTDTSIEIVKAIAEQRGDDESVIREAVENPEDFDSIVTRARKMLTNTDDSLRWQGRAIG